MSKRPLQAPQAPQAPQAGTAPPMPKVALCPLYVDGLSWLFARRKFKLMEDYVLYSPTRDSWFFAPAGFIFDGASVPRLLSWLISPTSVLLIAAVFHDLGYKYAGLAYIPEGNLSPRAPLDVYFEPKTKAELDWILRDVSHDTSGVRAPGWLGWAGATVGGWLAWWKHRRANRKMWIDYTKVKAVTA